MGVLTLAPFSMYFLEQEQSAFPEREFGEQKEYGQAVSSSTALPHNPTHHSLDVKNWALLVNTA